MKLSVAMVEPKHAINVGYVARLMKNFGHRELLLIKPKFDNKRAKVFAMHGKDVLEHAKIINFEDLRRHDLLIGTTALGARSKLNIVRNSLSPDNLTAILEATNHSCIVLGRESTGLTNRELNACDIVVSINTQTEYRTLNISHALAIIFHELTKVKRAPTKISATRSERDLLVKYSLELAKRSGYPEHKKHMLESTVRRLLARSVPTSKEVMLMVSLFRDALLTVDRNGAKIRLSISENEGTNL